MGENEETRETDGIGGIAEEESSAVAEIGVGCGIDDVAVEKARELGGGNRVVEDILTHEEIGGVKPERDGVHMEGGPTEPHNPEGQRVGSTLTATHIYPSLSLSVCQPSIYLQLKLNLLRLHLPRLLQSC